jgi:hypothetical protein
LHPVSGVGESARSFFTGVAAGVDGDFDFGEDEAGFPESAHRPIDQSLVFG